MTDLKNSVTRFPPMSAYDVLYLLVSNFGVDAIRTALDEMSEPMPVMLYEEEYNKKLKENVNEFRKALEQRARIFKKNYQGKE